MAEKLAQVLGRLDGQMAALLKNCQLLALWSQVVDDRVGKNTEPVKIRDQTLFVATASAVWAQELSLLKPEIIRKFNQQAGQAVIKDIRFRAQPSPGG